MTAIRDATRPWLRIPCRRCWNSFASRMVTLNVSCKRSNPCSFVTEHGTSVRVYSGCGYRLFSLHRSFSSRCVYFEESERNRPSARETEKHRASLGLPAFLRFTFSIFERISLLDRWGSRNCETPRYCSNYSITPGNFSKARRRKCN